MKANFLKVRQFLEESFPELRGKVTGANYPPPPIFELLQTILGVFQALSLAWIVIGGEKILRMAGFSMDAGSDGLGPKILAFVSENSFQIGLCIFLIIPQFIGRFAVSGAFEIYLNEDILIFSRLESGEFPKVGDLLTPLVNAGLQRSA